MKLSYKLFWAFLFFPLLTAILQSCCKEEEKYTGEGQLTAFYADSPKLYYSNPNYFDIDTIYNNQAFYLRQHFTFVIEQVSMNLNLINSAYATSCKSERINSINENSFNLFVNDTLIVNSDTLMPGTNLLDLNLLDIDFSGNAISWKSYDIHFSNKALNQINFDRKDYTFSFNAKTSNELKVKSSKKLHFK